MDYESIKFLNLSNLHTIEIFFFLSCIQFAIFIE